MRQRRRKTTSNAEMKRSAVSGFTFTKRKSRKKETAIESVRKGATERKQEEPEKKEEVPKQQTGEGQPLPNFPDIDDFKPKSYDDKQAMPEPTKVQRFFEDLMRHSLIKIKETYIGEHAYLAKTAMDVNDLCLNDLREKTELSAEKDLAKMKKCPIELEFEKLGELQEKWNKIEDEGYIEREPGLTADSSAGEDNKMTPLSEIYHEALNNMSTKGDEILQKLRASLRAITRHHEAQGKIAEILNHKAFHMYSVDEEAPKSYLEQFAA
mmetsp:Transcript_5909/g.8325  ORF Transcript_5909/g.8325 Transcript_5909/m.8325 type:complete len:267 (+) Transcript_5909:1-801(+)